MSKLNITPGRWQAEDTFDEDQYKLAGCLITSASGEVAFIRAVPDEEGDIDEMILTDEQRANARAIVALPDLINALDELLGEWDLEHADETQAEGYTPETEGVKMARAALAKLDP